MKTERPVTVNFRAPRKLHRSFTIKVKSIGTPSEVLRELMLAFVEDRIKIAPLSVIPHNRKEK